MAGHSPQNLLCFFKAVAFVAMFLKVTNSDHFRVENCQRSPNGDIFCETHFRRLFVAQSSFVFRPNQQFVITS